MLKQPTRRRSETCREVLTWRRQVTRIADHNVVERSRVDGSEVVEGRVKRSDRTKTVEPSLLVDQRGVRRPLRIKQRAGHRSFSTTEGYIREAENLTGSFGEPFPRLPVDLTKGFGLVSAFGLRNRQILARISGAKGDRTLLLRTPKLHGLSYQLP
jgi:hypothetical protein